MERRNWTARGFSDSQPKSSARIHGITLPFSPPRASVLFVTETKIGTQRMKSAFQVECRNWSLSEDGAVRLFLYKKITSIYKNKFILRGDPKLLISLKHEHI